MPQAKTIKQAKAAYKSRSEQPLTEREQKQLERSVQLERRAWGLREREKNKLDLAKKRAAQEKAQQAEERRIGTQRRNDKFGFKSSQFHLGAFFRKPAPALPGGMNEGKASISKEMSKIGQPDAVDKTLDDMPNDGMDLAEDEYEDVDDESLLEALQSPEVMRMSKVQSDAQARPDTSMPPPPRTAFAQHVCKPSPYVPKQSDAELDWHDFLESSTQIARELSTAPLTRGTPPAHTPTAKESLRTASFSSGSFELTEDDIEQLDPTPRAPEHSIHKVYQTKAADERMKMPPPPLPVKCNEQKQQVVSEAGDRPNAAGLALPTQVEGLEFSMTQLESFVEDDLQLTQV